MVAVRSTGYAFAGIIGYRVEDGEANGQEEGKGEGGGEEGRNVALVGEEHLRLLVEVANSRFEINRERMERFREALLEGERSAVGNGVKDGWEDAETRRRRKREEGLARQRALRKENEEGHVGG